MISRPDVVEQSDVLREQVERQQAGDDRQHLGGQEEEQHVGPLRTGRIDSAYAAGKASSRTRTVDRTLAVSELSSDGHGLAPPAPKKLAVALQRQRGEEGRRVGRRVGLAVERGQHHPQHRQDEEDPDDPGQAALRMIALPRLLAVLDGAGPAAVAWCGGRWRWRSSRSPPGTGTTRCAARRSR